MFTPDPKYDDVKEEKIFVRKGYEPLLWSLVKALDQSQFEKGTERHGQGRVFKEQPILTIGRKIGPGFALGQALKKIDELPALPTREAQIKEAYGAIVYLCGAIILLKEGYLCTKPAKEEVVNENL